MGVAFCSYSLVLAAVARIIGPERRSMALGLGTAAGSLGQVLFSPINQTLISRYGWYDSLLVMSVVALVLVPLAFILPGGSGSRGEPASDQGLTDALGEAMRHRSFLLLTAGFFVCGFHVAFITAHFPTFVTDLGLSARAGAYALSIVGLFNIIGSLLSGAFGQRYSKKLGLSAIYSGRALIILGLLLAPANELTVYLFAASMGLLWLSTVPLTTGIVAQMFGLKFMATLFGIVFLSHQVGGFLGVWLGGLLYDRTGSYDAMWWAGVGFGVFAALVHLPINDKPLARLRMARGRGRSRHTGLFLLVLAFFCPTHRVPVLVAEIESYSLCTVLIADFEPSSQEAGPSTFAVWLDAGSSHAPGYGDAFVEALIAWLLSQE